MTYINRSIKIQEAAKKLGIIKPVMERVANKVNNIYPHHTIDMMSEDIDNLVTDTVNNQYNIDITDWSSDEISSILLDLWEVIY